MFNAPPSPSKIGCCALRLTPPRPPQDIYQIYFESRGKCCKKLLRYNGYPNKVRVFILFIFSMYCSYSVAYDLAGVHIATTLARYYCFKRYLRFILLTLYVNGCDDMFVH